MLAGLLVPTSGSLEVNGYLPWKQRKDYVREIGVVFGQRTTLWWDLPLTDSIELLQRIYEIPEDVFKPISNISERYLNSILSQHACPLALTRTADAGGPLCRFPA